MNAIFISGLVMVVDKNGLYTKGRRDWDNRYFYWQALLYKVVSSMLSLKKGVPLESSDFLKVPVKL